MEEVKRASSALKSIIWRVMGVIVLATITYLVTRQWIVTTYITVVHHATFLLVFYLHDRAWMKFKKDIGYWRNVIKAFTYEVILGMGIGGSIVYLFTGSWSSVTLITPIYTVVKIVMYFFYDRIWDGKNRSIKNISK